LSGFSRTDEREHEPRSVNDTFAARAILSTVDLAEFEASLQKSAPPAGVHGALEALWHERRGDRISSARARAAYTLKFGAIQRADSVDRPGA